MNIKRFLGANSRVVMQQVRAELGADALIVANNATPDGVEILAVASRDLDQIIAPSPLRRPAPAVGAESDAPAPRLPESRAPGLPEADAARPPDAAVARSGRVAAAVQESRAAFDARVARETGVPRPARTAAPAPEVRPQPLSLRAYAEGVDEPDDDVAPAEEAFAMISPNRAREVRAARAVRAQAAAASAEHARVLAEIKAMKDQLADQIAALSWDDSLRRRPLRAALLKELDEAGFPAKLARAITEKLPDDFSANEARQWLLSVLTRNLPCVTGPDIVERGGVFALVGPTGVGKTTTTAKIAAACVMRHGAKGLGLITTDSYRVGAHDQLRIYGKILGVPVIMAQDATELRHALEAVAGKHLVLIDTIGMGQRDTRVAGQQALLSAPGIERLLLLNATAQTETLDDVVRAYGNMGAGGALAGAILTKTDEAVHLGGALSVLIRRRLPLHFFTDGQRVPEDIRVADADALVAQALKTLARPEALSPTRAGAAARATLSDSPADAAACNDAADAAALQA